MKKNITAVVAASGFGTRTGLEVPKQFYEIDNVPILAYTLQKICEVEEVGELIVAVPKEYILYTNDFVKKLGFSKPVKILSGEETRQKTVYKCLAEASNKSEFVLIHDGVRPFVDKKDIKNCIADAKKYGAAALGAKCIDTLKKSTSDGFISETVDRNEIYRIFTPQIFKRDLIFNAHKNAAEKQLEVTDDCALVEKNGASVKITQCEKNNLKITTYDDIMFAKAVLKWK